MKGKTYAKVIADSVSPTGNRILTLELKAPKFVDAEICKHRSISTSSSSDRAIPFAQNALNEDNLFMQWDVRTESSGMVSEETVDEETLSQFQNASYRIYQNTIEELVPFQSKIKRQHLNRFLLPWSMQRKIATASLEYWNYFLSLRDAYDADPAMQELARAVKENISFAIKKSVARVLDYGEWHLPYLKNKEEEAHPASRDISAARCARVSYDNLDGTKTVIEKDLKMAIWLKEHFHWTPFEHQCTPIPGNGREEDELGAWLPGITHQDRKGNLWSANLKGWIQYRKVIDGMGGTD